MTAIKCFISYSWDDAALATYLVERLKVIGYCPVIDQSILNANASTPQVQREILDRLEESDLFILLVTAGSLASLEVREEMALARVWGIPFVLACSKDVDRGTFPWFLQNHDIALRFDPSDRGPSANDWVDRLVGKISEKRSTYPFDSDDALDTARSIRASIRKIRHSEESYRSIPPFRLRVLSEVLSETQKEVAALVAPEYTQNLSLERTFIVRAAPIFRSAQRVYATSIDRLSRFWIASHQRVNAQHYTAAQPTNTIRMFVFSNPKSAQKYRRVLAAHHARYGTAGAVLLCSEDRYFSVVKDALGEDHQQHKQRFRDNDFGILVFTHAGNEEIYEAFLSQVSLECRRVSDTGMYRRLCEHFEAAAHEEAFRDKYHLIKWHKSFADNDVAWRDALVDLFELGGNDPRVATNQDVFHFVFFSDQVNADRLKSEIAEQIRILANLETKEEDQKLVKEIWFGRRDEIFQTLLPRDGVYGGTIRTDGPMDRYPYVLVMRIENAKILKEYYEDRTHSKVREQLYRSFDERIADIYELLGAQYLSQIMKKKVYEAIESGVGRYVMRADYLEHDDVDWIVKNISSADFTSRP